MHFPAPLLCGLLSLLVSLPSAAAQAPAEPVHTLQVTSRIVYIDVVVRDSSGKVVRGLGQKDFTLKENGQPQRIDLFEAHVTSNSRPTPPPPTREFTNVVPGAIGRSLNIVLLDLLDTAPLEQTYARDRMIDFLRALPTDRQVALFVLSDQLHMVQGFTADSSTLIAAARAINPKELNRNRGMAQQMHDLDLESYSDSQATIAGVGSNLERSLRLEDTQNLKGRLDAGADAFDELARAVNGYPGRKNLFWLSGSFPSSTTNSLQALSTGTLNSAGAPTLGAINVGQNPVARGASASGTSLSAGVGTSRTPLSERADRAVADSQIAVYPISVTGVETDSVDASQSGIGTANQRLADTMAQAFHDRQDSRSTMDHIAQETGGEAFYGSNDITHMLERGFEDSENYYTLAFQPTDHDWNGKYRKLSVALAGHGGTLSYRRGYYAFPEQPHRNDARQFQQAMRIDSAPSTMLVLRGTPALAPAATAAAPPQAQIAAVLDLHGVGFTTDHEGRRHARIEVGMMAYANTPDGKPPIQTAGTLNLSLTEPQYLQLLAEGVVFKQQLPLHSGKYVLRVGALDVGSGRIGTLTIPVLMP